MKLTDLKEGDLVEVTGFRCMDEHSMKEVKVYEGHLYVDCYDGKHYLEGQIDDDTGELIGITKVKVKGTNK